MRNIILFDDERSFKPGVKDDAIVLRTVDTAVDFFETMKETGFIIDELWLDFVLKHGTTVDALYALPGSQVKTVFFHSSAFMAKGLVEGALNRAGYEGEVILPDDDLFI